jgi:hypothetical protein
MANDEMAVDAVSSEPVSGLNSLVTGKFTRNFAASGGIPRPSNRDEVPANRPLLGIRKLPPPK